MAYDHALAERIRAAVAGRAGVTEREMFGGIGFMLGGNMFAGVLRNGLLVRVGPDGHAGAVAEPHTGPFQMGAGRAMAGYVVVAHDGVVTRGAVSAWVERAWAYVGRLPPKPARAAAGARKAPARKVGAAAGAKRPGTKKPAAQARPARRPAPARGSRR